MVFKVSPIMTKVSSEAKDLEKYSNVIIKKENSFMGNY